MLSPRDLYARAKFICSIKTGRLLDGEGNEHWFFHWKPHRDEAEGPAYVGKSGTKKWYRYGELHRDGGPAIEWADGGQEFFKRGQRHREDGPAIVRAVGENEYWKDGKAWPEGKPLAQKIEAKKKEEELQQQVQQATVVTNNNMQTLQTIRFKKPPPQLKP